MGYSRQSSYLGNTAEQQRELQVHLVVQLVPRARREFPRLGLRKLLHPVWMMALTLGTDKNKKLLPMKHLLFCCLLLFTALACNTTKPAATTDGWVSLFNGKNLDGWKASENPATFTVADGSIVVHGPRAHLFYEGPVMNHDFGDFEFKAQVMTTPGSNSGIFIHTAYQEEGWPAKGYEVQVNNSQSDWRRTGSIYSFDDVREVNVPDNEWYTQHIIVRGNTVTVKLNDKTVVEYVEPENVERPAGEAGRMLSSGTFALQGHDPDSKVYFKDIIVRPLAK